MTNNFNAQIHNSFSTIEITKMDFWLEWIYFSYAIYMGNNYFSSHFTHPSLDEFKIVNLYTLGHGFFLEIV